MIGDGKLSASKAADVVKRLLGIDSMAIKEIMERSFLKEAYEKALRLRPKNPRRTKQKQTGSDK